MLAATIAFIHDELGLSRIFYHTRESGVAAKRIDFGQPPRSMNTTCCLHGESL